MMGARSPLQTKAWVARQSRTQKIGLFGHYKNSFFVTVQIDRNLCIFDGWEVVGVEEDGELFTVIEGLFTKSCQTNGLLQNGGSDLRKWEAIE
jgi:hypothetical protein